MAVVAVAVVFVAEWRQQSGSSMVGALAATVAALAAERH